MSNQTSKQSRGTSINPRNVKPESKTGGTSIALSGLDEVENLFDQFSTFMKTNWRPLLMEAVAAGVTAYMKFGKDKKSIKASNSSNS